MVELDPLATQRDVAYSAAAELAANGFEDVHQIGRGGFGIVYRCRQPSLDRTVAVKVLTSDLNSEDLARFFREQRAMGRLSGHPNIVNIFDVGAVASGRPFIVMQYHPKDSLEARIQRDGPLGWPEALRVGVKIAGALETAHRLGVLHHDVKPGNILLTDYGEPQLTDFGIAHVPGGFETAAGTVTGSPAFTAPEVLRGEPPTAAADVYSLGATLFCALTGHAAFERRSGEQVVAQFVRITTEPIPDLGGTGIPDDVRAAIEQAMARSATERPATAMELGELFRDAERRNHRGVDEMALVGGGTEFAGDMPPWRDQDGPLPEQPEPVSDTSIPLVIAIRGKSGNLPLELTSFVGRRREVAETKRLLSASRLVTLTGIGGVGKTRLALRVAADTRRTYHDGVWLIELSGLRDPALLGDFVLAALGLRERSAHSPVTMLAEYLADRRLLLVVDNCEHLVDAVAALAEPLLRTCPELRILATSREPLGISGEAVMRVPPLAVPGPGSSASRRGSPAGDDAIILFTERARAAVPEFELTDHNKPVVTQICRRLDGLPLPIELAAARLRAMSAEQILQRLTDRYRLLTSGNRDAPTRQQTLRLCVDWSYGLCTPLEQQIWARVSIFAGSFELDAAENICANDLAAGEMLDAVASLVDKSILIREEPGAVVRFRLLETLRDYGREKLQQTIGYAKLSRQHRDWYQQLALQAEAEWISPKQLDWIARLKREQPNLREAMEFCLSEAVAVESVPGLAIAAALYPFWLSQGLLSEGRRWLDRLLAGEPGQLTTERVKALYADSVLAEVQGDLETGARLVEEGKALTEPGTDTGSRVLITTADGILALYSGDFSRACSCLEGALAIHDTWGEDEGFLVHVEILEMLGLAYELSGKTLQAFNCHQQVIEITASRGESVYRAYSLWATGVAMWRQGDRDRAVRLLEQGLRLGRLVDNPLTVAVTLEALAWVACNEHVAKRAVVLMAAAEAMAQSAGRAQPMGSTAVVFPNLVVYHEKCEKLARHALGEVAYHAAYQEGRELGMEEAVTYALGEQSHGATIPNDSTEALTKRERQVADLVAQGLSNKAIAANLGISPRTAQGHVEHILVKLGFSSRTQIATWLIEQKQAHRT
ncbi:protein kinase domain-containing protein [Rhodococcus wratislaviensis]|uniref:Putative serine/threonine protein kinase n=1 Tax=Rhodococcus wratislaviensis NBRC 100605 TaxID=1219028 RepID=X0R3U6_RHOWR|nr:protein kinase [Rhodococcus wratislaviensis]GAF45555.1 putative serine/threonine protein kinase [Rhodococcus wratislaviensis NBRC 100605]